MVSAIEEKAMCSSKK